MIFCIFKHIPFSVNKSNFHFKEKSRISTDSFNNIYLRMLQFNIVNSKSNNLSEIFVEFSLVNLRCNYELDWNNLHKNWVYHTKISENKTALFFYKWKQNENHHAGIVEDPC